MPMSTSPELLAQALVLIDVRVLDHNRGGAGRTRSRWPKEVSFAPGERPQRSYTARRLLTQEKTQLIDDALIVGEYLTKTDIAQHQSRAKDMPPFFKPVPPYVPPYAPGLRHTFLDDFGCSNRDCRGKKEKTRTSLDVTGL